MRLTELEYTYTLKHVVWPDVFFKNQLEIGNGWKLQRNMKTNV